jgi:Opioid growth factor receptor (OGFr) conserved region
MDPIVAFYSGGRDDRGRTLDEILAWADDQLETVHDYIQWVFPTAHPSAVNPFAPLVTPGTVSAFRLQPALPARLGQSFERMLSFYGLKRLSTESVEVDATRFRDRAAIWLHPGNHNHLRLTRIMSSLAVLGRREDALALQRCLLDRVLADAADRVSRMTLAFWRAAVDRASAAH